MPDPTLTLQERTTELSLADRVGCGAPRLMQKEYRFAVEFWLFEDDTFIIWSNEDLQLGPRSLSLSVSQE